MTINKMDQQLCSHTIKCLETSPYTCTFTVVFIFCLSVFQLNFLILHWGLNRLKGPHWRVHPLPCSPLGQNGSGKKGKQQKEQEKKDDLTTELLLLQNF